MTLSTFVNGKYDVIMWSCQQTVVDWHIPSGFVGQTKFKPTYQRRQIHHGFVKEVEFSWTKSSACETKRTIG